MEVPPKRGSVVSPAGEDGERWMVVVNYGCAEGEKGAGGKRSSREEDRTGKEEEEKGVQSTKGGGNEISKNNGKAFNAGRCG